MIERLARHQGAVYVLLAGYFIVNVIVRLLQPASLELDEGQQLFLAQWLAVGYDTQPPFYNWLQYGVDQWLGDTVLALSLLKNLLLFASYLVVGMIAHVIIRNRVLAVIATLGLITIPTIAYAAQRDLTHTVGLLFAACLFFYIFIRTLQNPSALNYALTGVAVGIGILAKYNFVLLPVVAAIAILPERQWRSRLFDPRILITLAIAAAMVGAACHLVSRPHRRGDRANAEQDDGGCGWPRRDADRQGPALAGRGACGRRAAYSCLVLRRVRQELARRVER